MSDLKTKFNDDADAGEGSGGVSSGLMTSTAGLKGKFKDDKQNADGVSSVMGGGSPNGLGAAGGG